jgi:hypothetical protein
MKAFLVSVNGKRVCLAGIGDNGVMGVAVQSVEGKSLKAVLKKQLKLIVGGLDSVSGEHVHWKTPQIGIGDKITIEIIEADNVDEAAERYVTPPNPESQTTKRKGKRQTR